MGFLAASELGENAAAGCCCPMLTAVCAFGGCVLVPLQGAAARCALWNLGAGAAAGRCPHILFGYLGSLLAYNLSNLHHNLHQGMSLTSR